MEGLNIPDDSPTACWLCAKDSSRKKSWSKIIGESRTRSIDTGMNELDRITGEWSNVLHMYIKIETTCTCTHVLFVSRDKSFWNFD